MFLKEKRVNIQLMLLYTIKVSSLLQISFTKIDSEFPFPNDTKKKISLIFIHYQLCSKKIVIFSGFDDYFTAYLYVYPKYCKYLYNVLFVNMAIH